MNYIQDPIAKESKVFPNPSWSRGPGHIPFAISAILTAGLRKRRTLVDYHLPWGVPHAGDYDLEELFNWIKTVCKNNNITYKRIPLSILKAGFRINQFLRSASSCSIAIPDVGFVTYPFCFSFAIIRDTVTEWQISGIWPFPRM